MADFSTVEGIRKAQEDLYEVIMGYMTNGIPADRLYPDPAALVALLRDVQLYRSFPPERRI